MGFLQDVFGGFKTKLRNKHRLSANQHESRGRLENIMQQVLNRGTELSDSPVLTATDLFSNEIRSLSDQARASANQTKGALSRALLSQGGDTSGAGAVNMLRADQGLNKSLGGIIDRFNTLARQISEGRQSRGDSLMANSLASAGSLYNTDESLLSEMFNQQLQKEQAQKQKSSSVFGSILSAVGTIAPAIIACWVAEELYPEEPEKVTSIRGLLTGSAQGVGVISDFAREYQAYGDDWAVLIRHSPEMRRAAKRLFDQFYELSKAA